MTGPALMAGAAAGTILGSAAGAALSRWQHGESLRSPIRSRCRACGTDVGILDLVPVISWLLLRGRCRTCASPIDVRYPMLEALCGVSVVAIVARHGVGATAMVLSVGAVASVLAGVIDLEQRIIPDRLTRPLAVVAVPVALLLSQGTEDRLAIVAWSLGFPLLLEGVARVIAATGRPRPIGGGDVKVLVGLLACASFVESGPASLLVLSVLVGGGFATIGLVAGHLQRADRIAFGPAIATSFLIVGAVPVQRMASALGLGV